MRNTAIRRACVVSAALLLSCHFSREIVVKPHQLLKPLRPGFVNSFNLEEQLDRGYVPEVLEFLAAQGPRGLDSTRSARALGQALLERGDFRACRRPLERALAQEGRPAERASIAWMLSQAAWWEGDFAAAARWGRLARSEGRRVPDGWITFLAASSDRKAYGGLTPGERASTGVVYGRPNLPRLPVRVNDRPPEELVLDSGASLSLLTDSAAERLGIEMIPGAVASAYGLHQIELPLRLGWARSVRFGGVDLTNVPFGILPDGTLNFQTTSAGSFSFPGVLGIHLMKEFDWRLELQDRRIQAVRLDPDVTRGSTEQNLFFRRMKPMVRASFNQEPWSLFLLDTGSEPTMATRAGLRKNRYTEQEGAYPLTLEGIGKSRVSWNKISNVTVGVDRFMVWFKDLVVKEESEGIEDGVLGNSFLANFAVEIRFGSMRLTLETPVERRLKRDEAPAVPVAVPTRG